jgi:antitoxin component of MazEF toxin-antitoxin module
VDSHFYCAPKALERVTRRRRKAVSFEDWEEPDLAQLLEGITDENLHEEISVGPAVGREA